MGSGILEEEVFEDKAEEEEDEVVEADETEEDEEEEEEAEGEPNARLAFNGTRSACGW